MENRPIVMPSIPLAIRTAPFESIEIRPTTIQFTTSHKTDRWIVHILVIINLAGKDLLIKLIPSHFRQLIRTKVIIAIFQRLCRRSHGFRIRYISQLIIILPTNPSVGTAPRSLTHRLMRIRFQGFLRIESADTLHPSIRQ